MFTRIIKRSSQKLERLKTSKPINLLMFIYFVIIAFFIAMIYLFL
jgi:hypothetical protein